MNRKQVPITLLLILLVTLLLGCNTQDEAEEGVVDIPPVIETNKSASAEAFVVPIQEADIAFETGGRVVELMAEEGDQISAGQVLARLDDADAQAAISAAEAALAQAEANLAQVLVGPTAEQIAVAKAAVSRVEANLAQVKAGATAEQIAAAEAAVSRAEANLAQVIAGPTPEDIAAAQARLDMLKAQLNQVLVGTRSETLEASMATVKQAGNALALAQTDYDKIAYAADSDLAQPIALALQDATLRYEAALANHQALLNGATAEEVAIVRAQVAEGQAALDKLLAGATTEQIAIAQIGVIEAEAALAQVMAGATPEQIEVAQTGVGEAEAALAQVKAGSTPEQIAAAEAGVRQAEAALAQARLALDHLQITAPFAGTITDLNVEVGETVSLGSPVINLANLSAWQIETDDLTEIDVVQVTEGQSAAITFDALPGETFSGTVSRIKPRSETKAGDVTYTVIIDLPDAGDTRLRWGMTAFVEIDTE